MHACMFMLKTSTRSSCHNLFLGTKLIYQIILRKISGNVNKKTSLEPGKKFCGIINYLTFQKKLIHQFSNFKLLHNS